MLRAGWLSMNGIIGTDKSGAVRPEPFDYAQVRPFDFAQDRRVEG